MYMLLCETHVQLSHTAAKTYITLKLMTQLHMCLRHKHIHVRLDVTHETWQGAVCCGCLMNVVNLSTGRLAFYPLDCAVLTSAAITKVVVGDFYRSFVEVL